MTISKQDAAALLDKSGHRPDAPHFGEVASAE
jgi:hypothetical protein